MKLYSQLTQEEQGQAVIGFTDRIVADIVENQLIHPDLFGFIEEIEAADDEAQDKQTPWFFGEILWEKVEESPAFQDALTRIATSLAKSAQYKEQNEIVVSL